MFEIGVMGFAARVPAIATGVAMAAEADGAHAVWYPDRLRARPDDELWRAEAGPLAQVTPDPADLADPFLAATTAALATRRSHVGVLGLDLGAADPDRLARAVATLAALAPDRAVVAFDAGSEVPGRESLARALHGELGRRELPVEVVLSGDDDTSARLAADLGYGWIADGPLGVEDFSARAGAGLGVPCGLVLPVVAHEDEDVAARALKSPLLAGLAAELGAAAAHVPVGTPDQVFACLRAYAAAGARRVVLDNLVALGAPYELEGGRRATRAIVRRARLELRDGES
jgi:alkanesulfonate monooxygenase SsuD/methylene tetrahydromethanopterin reductase-like flavin-dependent oxidoreductase (luciferase family)